MANELLQFDSLASARGNETTGPDRESVGDLGTIVDEVVYLASFSDIPDSEGPHLAISLTHRLVLAIVRLEASGCPRQRILEILQRARVVHSESPFVRRLQEWPRGYAGDFETVEYLVQQRNRAVAGRLCYFIEQYALGSPIAQQHRNKVDIQARELLSAVHHPNGSAVPKILVIAAGGSPDLRLVEEPLAAHPFEATLLDQDEDALIFSARHLPRLHDRLSFTCANVVRGLLNAAKRGPFDLVVAGGLFDYLPDRVAVSVLAQVRNRLLRAGGHLLFTNISCGNPYRQWIEYMADWFLIHRSAGDIRTLCAAAGFPDRATNMDVDRTGLTLIVKCQQF
jgi:extracellular factor (EF) 3-hydroxypalmitic acid methyl ester biosynthesis protein